MKNAIFWDVALVGTNVSEECIAIIFKAKGISKLRMLAVISNCRN
jgi:hypothetical protein